MSTQRNLLTVSAAGLFALSAPAAAQSFVDNQTDIPQGAPFNNSRTENVDFGDVDLDGDWDAIFADGGDAGSDQNRIWINQGGLQGGTLGVFLDDTAARFPAFADQSRDIEFVDVEHDGDLDIYTSNTAQITNQGNHWWINQGLEQGGSLGTYVDETGARWVGLNSANSSIADSLLLPDEVNPETFIDWSCDCDFGDLDNDGDLDLVHSSYGGAFGGQVPTRLFLNDGGGFFEEFNPSGFKLAGQNIAVGSPGIWCEGTQATNTTVADGSRCDVATSTLDIDIGDTDGDFDLDILHGDREQAPRFFQNRLEENGGSLGFRDVTGAVFPPGYSSGDGHYEQEMADMDGDGDLDIYGLNWDAGGFSFNDVTLENDGTGNFTNTTILAGSGSDDNEGDFIDYDNDGDMDLFIANFSGANRLYRNDNNGGGSGFSFTNVSAGELPGGNFTSLDADAADVDGDGDYDVFESNDFNARNRYYENVTNIPDTTAANIPNVEAIAGGPATRRDDAFRAHVYDNAPYYVTWYNKTFAEVSVDGVGIGSFAMLSSAGQVFRGEIPGNLVGDVSYHVTSEDEHGNVGVSAASNYTNTGDTGVESGDTSPSSVGTPRVRALSEPMAGQQMYVLASGVAPGTVGTLFVSDSSMASVDTGDGVILSVGPLLIPAVAMLADADGNSLVAVKKISPGLAGVTLYLQYFGEDGVGGNTFASSNRLELTF